MIEWRSLKDVDHLTLWVTCCRPERASVTAGVPRIVADLMQRRKSAASRAIQGTVRRPGHVRNSPIADLPGGVHRRLLLPHQRSGEPPG